MPSIPASYDEEQKKFVFSANWLPECNTRRTNSKIVTETIAWYYKYYNKTKTLYKGKKPEFLPQNKITTKKELQHYLHVEKYANPILHARELQQLMSKEGLSQNKLAKKLGISRVRVTQILNLLKLSEKQQDYILKNGKEKMITERKLRGKSGSKISAIN